MNMKSLYVSAIAVMLVVPAFAATSGPAAQAVTNYMKSTKAPCYNQAGESMCSIASLNQGTKVFYSDNASAQAMAVAFVTYQYDTTGNAMDQMAIVFRKDGERWIPVGRADNTVGTSPRNVRFSPNEIVYTGTIVGPNDIRANPTGAKTFRLLVSANGVTFGGKGNAGTSMSNEIQRRR